MTADGLQTEGNPPPRCRRVMRRVQVTRMQQLSPHMICVAFTGDDLAAFGWFFAPRAKKYEIQEKKRTTLPQASRHNECGATAFNTQVISRGIQ